MAQALASMASLGQLLLRRLEHQAMGTLHMGDLCPPTEGGPADQCHRMQTRTKASLPLLEGNSHLCTEIKIHHLTIRTSLPLTLVPVQDQAPTIIKAQASTHSQQCRLTITITPQHTSFSMGVPILIPRLIAIHPLLRMDQEVHHLPWG